MSRTLARLIGLSLLLLVGVLALLAYHLSGRAAVPAEVPAAPPAAGDPAMGRLLLNDDCVRCHPAVAREWSDSIHAASYTDRYLWAYMTVTGASSDLECRPCHLPGRLLDEPPAELPPARNGDPQMGVNCIACHARGSGVVGTQGLSGPCRPIRDPVIRESAFCGRCHKAYTIAGTKHEYEEWLERSELTASRDCVDCHMPEVERISEGGGPVRKGKDHRFACTRSAEVHRAALGLGVRLESDRVIVDLENRGTAHCLPTGYTIRAIEVTTEIADATGVVRRVHRELLKKSPTWGGANTQLADGERRSYAYPLEGLDQGRVSVSVCYRRARIIQREPPLTYYEKRFVFEDGGRSSRDVE